MKIGFEAKRAFHNHTGLGNYSRQIIQDLNEFYRDAMIEKLKEEDFDYWFNCGWLPCKKCNELNSNCEC